MRLPRPVKASAAVLVLGAALGGSHAAGVHLGGRAGAIPPGGSYTQESWARALLRAGGWPETKCNLAAIVAWENAEGGNWNNTATFNPLNTARWEPGSYVVNGDGVRAYRSWHDGLAGNLAALDNGLYGPVLAALDNGNDAQAVADAVAQSRWGTRAFSASC